jgi:hypothetical protein
MFKPRSAAGPDSTVDMPKTISSGAPPTFSTAIAAPQTMNVNGNNAAHHI